MDYSKAALNIWCGKKKLKINYDITGVEIFFKCELSIDSINHVAIGTGQNKKTASNLAALVMLIYLIEKKYIYESELRQPCYATLQIRERLFPGGVPLTLDKVQIVDAPQVAAATSGSTFGTTPKALAAPVTPNKPKQDWWNDSGQDGLTSSSPTDGSKKGPSPYWGAVPLRALIQPVEGASGLDPAPSGSSPLLANPPLSGAAAQPNRFQPRGPPSSQFERPRLYGPGGGPNGGPGGGPGGFGPGPGGPMPRNRPNGRPGPYSYNRFAGPPPMGRGNGGGGWWGDGPPMGAPSMGPPYPEDDPYYYPPHHQQRGGGHGPPPYGPHSSYGSHDGPYDGPYGPHDGPYRPHDGPYGPDDDEHSYPPPSNNSIPLPPPLFGPPDPLVESPYPPPPPDTSKYWDARPPPPDLDSRFSGHPLGQMTRPSYSHHQDNGSRFSGLPLGPQTPPTYHNRGNGRKVWPPGKDPYRINNLKNPKKKVQSEAEKATEEEMAASGAQDPKDKMTNDGDGGNSGSNDVIEEAVPMEDESHTNAESNVKGSSSDLAQFRVNEFMSAMFHDPNNGNNQQNAQPELMPLVEWDGRKRQSATEKQAEMNIPAVGNFTLDNAKQQLNIYMQIHRIKIPEYKYDSYGPPHSKTFTATMKFFIRDLGREVCISSKGASKQDASRLCALTILHQLYSEGLIEQFKPEAPSKRQLLKMNLIYEVKVHEHLKNFMITMYNTVQAYNQYINPTTSAPIYGPGYAFHNPLAAQLLRSGVNPNAATADAFNQPNYLYWCPPLENFNPWTNTKPDDAIFPGKSMEEINVLLQEQFKEMIKKQQFQTVLNNRMKLPIYCIKDEVIRLISDHPVLIIKGSTGCGKTTQVPQFILDSFLKMGNGANCNIVVTQPRRISAISISERVAYERIENLAANKSSVGYSVRFDHTYPRPYGSILFCTTGHLLRRIQSGLKGISHLIIDEVHERDTNTDLLLVIVRDLIKMGLELKVVVMSATIGVQRFQKYFNSCHVLEIDGTLFPVQRHFLEDTIEIIKWRPKKLSYLDDDIDLCESLSSASPATNTEQQQDTLMDYDVTLHSYSTYTVELMRRLREGVICFELIVAILEYIDKMYITGAVLIFLPGWTAIFELLNHLKVHRVFGNEQKFVLLPLHSQLSYKDNHRVFQKMAQRKIILSTNIAETSITIDDVVFVIDTCLLKRKVYCSKTNVTSYIVDWVSKSNIQQRQGRAGRVRSGYFFALCSKKRYEALEDFKIPEILVTSLVETSLLIKYLGFGNVPEFLKKCLDPPPHRSVMEALSTLRDINAFDEHDQLTPLGTILVKLPIDPRLGRMLMLSVLLNVAGPILSIVAACATNHELFENKDINQSDFITKSLIKLDDKRISDHLILFKIYHLYDKQQNLEDYRYCLNLNAIFQVQNARKQLVDILTKCGLDPDQFISRATYTPHEIDVVVGLLVTAFYPNVCIYKETRRILTNEEKIGLVHKTSVLYSYIVDQKITKSTSLKSPLFVYSEKSANNNLISSKQMSMITFMQLLLFGIRKYEFPVNSGVDDTVILDGWLEIKVDPQVFDCTWVVKTELENILTRVCYQPATIKSLSHIENSILSTVKNMCSFEYVEVDIVVKPTPADRDRANQ